MRHAMVSHEGDGVGGWGQNDVEFKGKVRKSRKKKKRMKTTPSYVKKMGGGWRDQGRRKELGVLQKISQPST